MMPVSCTEYLETKPCLLQIGDKVRHKSKFRAFHPIRSIRRGCNGPFPRYFIILEGGRSFSLDFEETVELMTNKQRIKHV